MCVCCALTRRPPATTDCLDTIDGTADGAADGGAVAAPGNGPQVVSGLASLLSGSDWNGGEKVGQSAFVTYSFDAVANEEYDDSRGFTDSFRPLSQSERDIARRALDQWADVSGLEFLEVAPGNGDITFGVYDIDRGTAYAGSAGYAYFPGRYVFDSGDAFQVGSFDVAGDIIMDDDQGGPEWFHDVVLHEIGHAIGLKHPFEGDVVLRGDLDNTASTVMSYTSAGSGPTTRLGRLDIDAVRHLYGTKDGGHLADWSWAPGAGRLTQTGTARADFIIGVSVRDTIEGGAGDDRIGGMQGNDLIRGGAGNDRIDGGAGDDLLIGGAGDDVIEGGDGNDRLDALAGDDVLVGGGGDDVYHVDSDTSYDFVGGRSVTTGDVVREWADGGTDTIVARVSLSLPVEVENGTAIGAVDLYGNDLDNVLRGSALANTLKGGDGKDRLFGGAGDDDLAGGSGADRLDGGAGFDFANYEDAVGRIGIDLNGKVQGGAASGDVLVGIEAVRGTRYDDALRGSRNDERLEGGYGDDLLDGRYGDDVLDGWYGDDRLFGGGGDDVLMGGGGADRLDGGIGRDTADYGGELAPVLIDLATGRHGGTAQGDVLVSIEVVRGSDWDDTLSGAATADWLEGGQGADTIEGRAGNDRLFGGDGNDRLFGGLGDDVLEAGSGVDELRGQAGTDTASYASSTDGLTADLFLGGSRGDAEFDTYGSIENLVGSRAGDVLAGNAVSNRIDGGTGFDVLFGRAGNDVLLGGAQNDFLSGGLGDDALGGGAGNDRLRGDAGADRLFGATGNDLFVYLAASDSSVATGIDTILDFQSGQDRIDLSRIDANGAAAGNGAFDFIGARAFTGADGEVRFVAGQVRADVNGDRVADLVITVNGVAAMGAADFVL